MPHRKHTSRARRVAIGLALYCSAVAIGLGSAWWVLKKAPWMSKTVQVGAWKSPLRAGGPDADMYTRAFIATNGLLALGRNETIYFYTEHDDAGRRLRSDCTYRVEGIPPRARWWSIAAYADDLYFFDAPNQHYSLNGTTAKLDSHGRFAFTTGPNEQSGTYWLPTPGRRNVVLTLRLYNPEPELQAAPTSMAPPSVQALGACA